MKVGWLIDADLFDGYRDELVAAIQDQGHDAKLIHALNPPFRWDDVGCSYRETCPANACLSAHGDIELMTRIHPESEAKGEQAAKVRSVSNQRYELKRADVLAELDANRISSPGSRHVVPNRLTAGVTFSSS